MNRYSFSIRQQIGITLLGGFCILPQSYGQVKNDEEDGRMNILFLLDDDIRWNSLGCMGNSIVQTPNIDTLANGAIKFTNACVTSAVCMVSRASILTGQYMSRHGIQRFGVPISQEAFLQTYPAILRKAGYWSGFVGKYGVGFIRNKDFDFSRAYERVHWYPLENGDSIHVTERNKQDALEFLKGRPKDKPFVLSVSFFAPHAQDNHPDQYRYQPESEKYYRDDTIPVPETAPDNYFHLLPDFLATEQNEGRRRWHIRFDTPEKYQKYMKAYYRMITEVDEAVGEILAELKREGVYENTIIIFMGDNGYFQSDHGLADKWYPYNEAVRVPLIIKDPRLPVKNGSVVNEEFALNIDIAPTIITAAGLTVPDGMQGKDLSELYLSGKPVEWRQDFYYEHPVIRDESFIPSSEAIITHTDTYIYWPYYKYEEYFNMEEDPLEIHNGMNDSENEGRILMLKDRFGKLKGKAGKPGSENP